MTLEDLREAAKLLPPGASVTLSREAILTALDAGTIGASAGSPAAAEEKPEEWLTAVVVAELLHVSARWCYDHEKELGARRLSRRCVRFSSRAVAKYMARRN